MNLLDKTKCIWFGCVRPPENIVLHEVNIEWNPEKFIVLGVEFTTDLKEITKINLKKEDRKYTTRAVPMDQKESYTNRQNNCDSISYASQDSTHTDSSPRSRHARDKKKNNWKSYFINFCGIKSQTKTKGR